MRLRNTEHLELSTKMDSKCTHKKDSLHVFWMLKVIYKKTEPNRRFFFQNRTETEPNLKNPFRTSLLLYLWNSANALNYCQLGGEGNEIALVCVSVCVFMIRITGKIMDGL